MGQFVLLQRNPLSRWKSQRSGQRPEQLGRGLPPAGLFPAAAAAERLTPSPTEGAIEEAPVRYVRGLAFHGSPWASSTWAPVNSPKDARQLRRAPPHHGRAPPACGARRETMPVAPQAEE